MINLHLRGHPRGQPGGLASAYAPATPAPARHHTEGHGTSPLNGPLLTRACGSMGGFGRQRSTAQSGYGDPVSGSKLIH
ncbi:hypothetical protein DPEC_G00117060 [Dallia pectoralis]|uniref:Uncharacterized protein n=1 Tax=Dallia pectoralis TaxID=75939 RepID=A0ACC2GV35_DALPE|nr:hypothetical protein DPEC_G00117060 [Dallia pectoralis]